MKRTLYTADPHLDHFNIIRYCGRPFKTKQEMNESIVVGWNSVVLPTDTVICVGDFSFGDPEQWITRLNGRIVFVRGNHDRGDSLRTPIEKLYTRHSGVDVCVVHWPDHADFNMRYNLVGHVHDNWKFQERVDHQIGCKYSKEDPEHCGYDRIRKTMCINVGMDQWGFRPVTFEQIMSELKKWKRSGDALSKSAEI